METVIVFRDIRLYITLEWKRSFYFGTSVCTLILSGNGHFISGHRLIRNVRTICLLILNTQWCLYLGTYYDPKCKERLYNNTESKLSLCWGTSRYTVCLPLVPGSGLTLQQKGGPSFRLHVFESGLFLAQNIDLQKAPTYVALSGAQIDVNRH